MKNSKQKKKNKEEIVVEEKTSFTPFDFVNDITHGKKDIIHSSSVPSHIEKQYNAFIVNKSLSYFDDTILFANEMNRAHHLFPSAQYDYLLNTIRSRKRFSKWIKPEKNDDIDLISNFYEVNKQKAKQYIEILSKEQIDNIRDIVMRGKNQKGNNQ